MVDDFIETGERVMDKLKRILKSCELPMLKAGREARQAETVEKQKSDENSPLEAQISGPSSCTATSSSDSNLLSSICQNSEVTIGHEDSKASEKESALVRRQYRAKQPGLGKNAGIEFINTIFGRDRQLEATEKFMASIKLWNLRFDANCEEIIRRPDQ